MTVQVNISKLLLNGGVLVNVCWYPSAGNGGNNNPFDCIVNPGSGFLVIVKNAGNDTTTSFPFMVAPRPRRRAPALGTRSSDRSDGSDRSRRRQRDPEGHRDGARRMAAHGRGVRSCRNDCHRIVRRRQQPSHGHLDSVWPRDDLHVQRRQGQSCPHAGEDGDSVHLLDGGSVDLATAISSRTAATCRSRARSR